MMWLSWLRTKLDRRRPVLRVPRRLSRNSRTVAALMTPEQSGLWLLERMRTRIGFESYAGKRVLDFGCGVRFSQAILNSGLPFGFYAGVDNYRPVIDFLNRNVRDQRFRYAFLDAYHPIYNPSGQPLRGDTRLPLAEHHFDLVCMFSVITHQNPAAAGSIFSMLRRYVKPEGHLFFTSFSDSNIAGFEDRSRRREGEMCFYNPQFLQALVERSGWRWISRVPAEGPLIADAVVCRPA